MIKKFFAIICMLLAIVSLVLIISSFIDAIKDAKKDNGLNVWILLVSFLGDSWDLIGLFFLSLMFSFVLFLG